MPAHSRRHFSLRLKLILAGLCVQVLVFALTVWSEIGSTEDSVSKDLARRVKQSAPLLNAALVEPLLQRDYATLGQILDETQHPDDYKYLLLLDAQGRTIAASGMLPPQPLPAVDLSLSPLPWDRPDHCLHLQHVIEFRGQTLGILRYGLALEPSRQKRDDLIRSTSFASVLGLLLGTTIFALIGLSLTRGLRQLAQASEKIGRGEYDLALTVQGADELAQLARAFNDMARAVHNQVAELRASEAKQTQYLQQATQEKARLHALLHAMRLGVLLVDSEHRVLYANEAVAHILQLNHAHLQGEFWQDEPASQSSLLQGPFGTLPKSLLSEPADPLASSATEVMLPSGVDVHVSSVPVLDQAGAGMGRLWLLEDITAERQTQRLMHQLAAHDSLTGLLNRHTFNQLLSSRLTPGAERLALLFVDLDGFKLINDLNGHALGDLLLKSVADAMTLTVRPDDAVARLGGDEFAVAVQGLSHEQLAPVCERLLRNVANASGAVMAYSANPVKISCSIGVAWFPDDAVSADSLIAAADQAMYAAKAAGRNTWREHHVDLLPNRRKVQWLVWSERLNDAFERNLFEIYVQGIHHAQTSAIDHHEALVRLADPAHPGAFYPLGELIMYAEDSGKIVALDRMMLTRSIEHLARNPEHPPIAVNISTRTLVDTSLTDFIEECLSQAQVRPERLHLELTETAALTNIEQASQTVQKVQRLGCKVGLDDFGSGFTSFTYLRDLKVDYIKMDGSFVRGLKHDRECQILLQAVVDIAHASGRRVVAEWVEDEALLNLVRAYGVDLVQGYYFGQPRPL